MGNGTVNDTLYFAESLLPALYIGFGSILLAMILERAYQNGKRTRYGKRVIYRRVPRTEKTSVVAPTEPTEADWGAIIEELDADNTTTTTGATR